MPYLFGRINITRKPRVKWLTAYLKVQVPASVPYQSETCETKRRGIGYPIPLLVQAPLPPAILLLKI